jgi:hypothetical protein
MTGLIIALPFPNLAPKAYAVRKARWWNYVIQEQGNTWVVYANQLYEMGSDTGGEEGFSPGW